MSEFHDLYPQGVDGFAREFSMTNSDAYDILFACHWIYIHSERASYEIIRVPIDMLNAGKSAHYVKMICQATARLFND